MNPQDPISLNVAGVGQLVSSGMNKTRTGSSGMEEGVDGEFEDQLSLKLDDRELLHLSRLWTNKYATYEPKIKVRQQANETYYLGRQKESGSIATTDGQPIAANLIFEAEETFLPAALAKNPEPVVWSDKTPEGEQLSNTVKTMLQYHATVLCLRRKLAKGTRKWTIDFLGVWKHGWDDEIKEICLEVRNAKDMVFDPDGYVDEYGDFIGYLGERITITADKLIELFPKHSSYITVMVDGKMGTDVTYTEWWTDDYTFVTFKDRVLDKSKNPNFNYPKKTLSVDENGEPSSEESDVVNHFFKPKKPYTFLSVFSLGEHPHDDTGLIEQNIPNQRRVSRRTEQIDYNLSRANNSTVYSETNFNQETAKQAATAMAKGHPVLVPPGGPIAEALHQFQAMGIDKGYFDELEVSKEDLRSSFGTLGLTATPPEPNNLATGIVANENHDSSRIGGGINDAIEQVASNIFNHWTQLYCVFYDEPHEAAILGKQRAVEYVQLRSSDMNRKLVITVSPDSMKPKDEVSEAARWTQLYSEGLIDPKKFFNEIDDSDPQKTSEQAALWIADKATYMQINYPEVFQQIQQMQAQQQQAQVQAQQQQTQMEGQQGQQEMAQKAQSGQQDMQMKQAQHEQKLSHAEDLHKQKLEHAPPKSEGGEKKKANERPKKKST